MSRCASPLVFLLISFATEASGFVSGFGVRTSMIGKVPSSPPTKVTHPPSRPSSILNCASEPATTVDTLIPATMQHLDFRQVDQTLAELTLILDDTERRHKFKQFIRRCVEVESKVLSQTASTCSWNSKHSPFVEFANARLTMIGTEVQQAEWANYVTSGFQIPQRKPPQQWACVDMLVQLGILVRKAESEEYRLHRERQDRQQKKKACKNCAMCQKKKAAAFVKDALLLP